MDTTFFHTTTTVPISKMSSSPSNPRVVHHSSDLPDGPLSSRNLGRISSRHSSDDGKATMSWVMHSCTKVYVCNTFMPRICMFVSAFVCLWFMCMLTLGFRSTWSVKVCSLLMAFLCITPWDIPWQDQTETTPQGSIHGKMSSKLYVMLQVSTSHGCPVPIQGDAP